MRKLKIEKIICVATDKTNRVGLEQQLEIDKHNVFIKNALETPSELVDLLEDTKTSLKLMKSLKKWQKVNSLESFTP